MKTSGRFIIHDLPIRLAGLQASAIAVDRDDHDSAMPAALRNWLVRLRLLEGVPFANLITDSELLPEESIRWFYIDRRWTDALVQGALSVGTVNTDDRTHLSANYPAIRDELDSEERNFRRSPGSLRWQGEAGAISGFLLRSRAVSGWPALHVRAFNIDPEEGDDAFYHEEDARRMRLLRLERLAPAVLLCLFDGIPSVVHVEEPRQGVQFGFAAKVADGRVKAMLQPRYTTTFDDLPGPKIEVPFRNGGAPGVIDIQSLERRLATRPGTGAVDRLDSAEYALQLLRFPYRQVFGVVKEPALKIVFRPTVAYKQLRKLFTEIP